jgi:hypothetical protein
MVEKKFLIASDISSGVSYVCTGLIVYVHELVGSHIRVDSLLSRHILL